MAARRTAAGLSSTTGIGRSDVYVSQVIDRSSRLVGGGVNQQLLANDLLDGVADFRVVFQVLGGVGLALPDLVALVAVPGAGFLDQAQLYAQVDDLASAVDALAVHDLEFGLAERRGHFVL